MSRSSGNAPGRFSSFWRWMLLVLASVVSLNASRLIADDAAARADRYGDPLPVGAAVRLGTVRYRTPSRVVGLAFADDHQSLIYNVGGDEILVVEAATGRTVRSIPTEGQSVSGLCLTSDRRTIVTFGTERDTQPGGRKAWARSWDFASGKLVSRLSALDVAGTAAFDVSHDGRTLVVGSHNATIHCWDLAKERQLAERRFDGRRIDAVAISPDGQLIAISATNQLGFWEWLTDKQPEWMALGRRVQSLAFSPDGSMLAEGPDSRKDIVLREVASRQVLRTLSNIDVTPLLVRSLVFTPDGKHLIAPNSVGLIGNPLAQRVHLWDVTSGAVQQQFSTSEHHPYRLAISGDGRWLAAAGGQQLAGGTKIDVWDLRTGQLMGDDLPSHSGEVTMIRFSHDGTLIATASDDDTVRIWDAATGKQRQILRHGNWVRGVAFSPDGRLVASSSLDDTVRIWETATAIELQSLPGHGKVGGYRALAFSTDGRRLLSWGDDCQLRTWDMTIGTFVGERLVHRAEMMPPERNRNLRAAIFSADGVRLTLATNAGISLFDVETGKELHALAPLPGAMIGVALPSNAARIAASWAEDQLDNFVPRRQHICLREFASGEVLFDTLIDGQLAGKIAYSDDGRLVAAAGRVPEARVSVLDAATGAVLVQFPVGANDTTNAVALAPDGSRLACALSGGTVLLWELTSLTKPKK